MAIFRDKKPGREVKRRAIPNLMGPGRGTKYVKHYTTVNRFLVGRYLRWQSFLHRAPVRPTKTRADVAFSTRKLRPQKHTGRAPVGPGGNPMLRKGGVAHGPKLRDVSISMNRRERHEAVKHALSMRVGDMYWYPLSLTPITKTREAAELIGHLRRTDKERVLLLTDRPYDTLLPMRSVKNLRLLNTTALNTKDLLYCKYVVVDEAALPGVNKRFDTL